MRGIAVAALLAGLSFAQAPRDRRVITTIAGTASPPFEFPVPARQFALPDVSGMAQAPDGSILLTLTFHNLVLRLAPDGVLHRVAGTGIYGLSGDDGPAVAASFRFPNTVAVDELGVVHVVDLFNQRIRRISPDGTISNREGFVFPPPAPFTSPGIDIVAAPGGDLIILDASRARIVRLDPAGNLTLIAGNGQAGYSGDNGPATAASINPNPSIALAGNGDIYLADSFNGRIRRIRDGIITTVAGNGIQGFSGDNGPATAASLNNSISVTVDNAGNLYISESLNRIRRVSPDGVIRTIGGNGTDFTSSPGSPAPDGVPATEATIESPRRILAAADGSVVYYESRSHRLRSIGRDGVIRTIAGNGQALPAAENVPAATVPIGAAFGLTFDSSGNLYFSDGTRIRRISITGLISTIAGTGISGFSGDGGPAIQAVFSGGSSLRFDRAGNLFVADTGNRRVRRISPDGTIRTVAGGGGSIADDIAATSAEIGFVRRIAVDSAGDLLIAASGVSPTGRIRKVTQAGLITTVVGNGPLRGRAADGQQASQVGLGQVDDLTVDSQGNIYVFHELSFLSRVSRDGTFRILAGDGLFFGAEPPDGANVSNSYVRIAGGLAVDPQGNVCFATGVQLRCITPQGTIFTIAGTGALGFAGDGGPAVAAGLDNPFDLVFDASGNLFFADSGRIRAVLAAAPRFSTSATALRFSAPSGGAPTASQQIGVTTSVPAVDFSVSLPPPWLTVSDISGLTPRLLDLRANPTGLAPGAYTATIKLASFSASATIDVSVTFDVGPGLPPALTLDRASLTFTFPRQSARRTQFLSLGNSGSGTLTAALSTTTESGGSWLSVSPSQLSIQPGAPVGLTVAADPAGLAAGTYTGFIRVDTPAGTQSVRVTMTVSARDTAILLSQTGLSFIAVAGGGLVPPQTFGVINIGTGAAPWSLTTSTISGGSGWLIAGPASGVSLEGIAAPSVEVRVQPAGLAPGRYYGLVTIDSPGAANTPQVVAIFLEVLTADQNPGATIQPPELVFTRFTGRQLAGAQELRIFNPRSELLSFRTATPALFTVLPIDGTVPADRPRRMYVQPGGESQLRVAQSETLQPGVYRERLTIQFSDGVIRGVDLVSIVPATAPSASKNPAADGCGARKLQPTVFSLGQAAQVPAGAPAALDVEVRDDCGAPLNDGAVVVSFSNGDAPLPLQPLRDGHWQGTWNIRGRGAAVTLSVQAFDASRRIEGSAEYRTDLRGQQDPPLLSKEGIVSAGAGAPNISLAPGAIISLYGARLADRTESSTAAPLPTSLGGALVTMAGRALPLFYAGPDQINAQVPWDIEPNTLHQVLVRRGQTYTSPVQVSVAPAQPSLFRYQADGDQALIVVARGAQRFLNTEASPARAGDTLIVYSLGLGPVTPTPASGAASPASPLSELREGPVLRIGGMAIPVSFAGLTPESVGLYQVQATLPEGVPSGSAVSIRIESAGQISPELSLAIAK